MPTDRRARRRVRYRGDGLQRRDRSSRDLPIDVDDTQSISAREYEALFRAAFNRELAGGDGRYSRSEFTREFLAFMSGSQPSTAYDPMFSQE